jgi:hypothetical protein
MIEHHIDLVPDARPVRSRPYRAAPAHTDIIESKMKEMEEEGIIKECITPWASPKMALGGL